MWSEQHCGAVNWCFWDVCVHTRLTLSERRLIQIKCSSRHSVGPWGICSLLLFLSFFVETCSSAEHLSLPLRSECRLTCGSGVLSSMQSQALLEERLARSTSPSLLTATVGQRVLSRLDDGSGCSSPERVMALWTEEGIRNSRNILQVRTRNQSSAVWGWSVRLDLVRSCC